MTLFIPMLSPEGDHEAGGLFWLETSGGQLVVVFRTEEAMAAFAMLVRPMLAPGTELFAMGTSAESIDQIVRSWGRDGSIENQQFIMDDDPLYASVVIALAGLQADAP